tara:strand:+ start:1672 stop:1890 length:219 start_codon:yes stop_codon:yes gene_type:complete
MKITVDLHGKRHHQVEKILEKKLLNGKKDYLKTEIITGNSEPMRQLVHDFLDEHDFKYVVTEWNMGRTVIVG